MYVYWKSNNHLVFFLKL